MDYTYTIQGWIKSLNGSRLHKHSDPGNDGQGFHGHFGEDVFSYSLDYFNGDYQAVGTVQHLMDKGSPNNAFNTQLVGLFNGNIAAITTNILQPNGASNLQAQLFRYDALNRLKQSVTVDAKQKMLHNGPLSWNNSTTNTLSSTYSYDSGGNLSHLTRKNESNQTFDNFEYQYNTNTNQLNHIKDYATVNNGIRTDDIDNQIVGNYNFDSDGRLTKDVHDGITNIIWTRDNRPKQVTKNFNGINEVINYHYDFQGFKVIQTINRNDSVFKQHYVRDPQGSILAIYTDTSATNYKKLTLSELSIYGSSRLGTIQLDSVLYKQNGNNIVIPTISNVYTQKLGLKRYELSNHLGNISTVVSDRKFIQGNGQNAYFVADVISVTDYYAYGMKISERTWGKDARYQYNGKEQDKGFGRYNFDGRMYDERSCRWMSLDPKAAKYAGISPYVGFGNNPILFVDPDGEDIWLPIGDDNIENNKLLAARLSQITGMNISVGEKNGKPILKVPTKFTTTFIKDPMSRALADQLKNLGGNYKSATILAYSYNIGFDDYETQALNPDYFGKKGDNTAFLHFFIEQEDKTAKKLNGVKTQEGYLDDHLLGRGAHVKASLTEIEIAIPGISTSKDLSNKYYGDLLFENKEQGITSETFGSPPENFGDKAPDKPQEVKVERGLKIDSNKNMTFYYRLFRENNGQQETLKTTQYPPKK